MALSVMGMLLSGVRLGTPRHQTGRARYRPGRAPRRSALPRERFSPLTQSRRWMFGRIFGLDCRKSYRELRPEPLCWPSPSTPRNCSA
jgi:hypothetical protein